MNTQKIIRYKLKSDRVAENEERIKAVFRQIHDKKPAGVRYAVYKLADGVSFVHMITYDPEAAHQPVTNRSAFQEVPAQARDRFEELALASDAEDIGSY